MWWIISSSKKFLSITSIDIYLFFSILAATISAKQIQRGYKKVFEQVNKDNVPVVVITNNKPVGALISLDLLDKLNRHIQLELLEKEALDEYNKGEATKISTAEELQEFFEDIRKTAK